MLALSSGEESPAPSQQLGLGRHFVGRRMLGRNVALQCPLWAQPGAGCAATALPHRLGHRRDLVPGCNRAGGGGGGRCSHTAGVCSSSHSPAGKALPEPGTAGITCRRSQPDLPHCLLLPGAPHTDPQRAEIKGLEKLRSLDLLKKHFERVLRRLCQLRKGT